MGEFRHFQKMCAKKYLGQHYYLLKPQSKQQPKLQNIDDFEIIGIKRNLIFLFF